jgi:hypothetical protein
MSNLRAYAKKTDDELRYIISDASGAAMACRDCDGTAEAKYLDQVNDATTTLAHRATRAAKVATNAHRARSDRAARLARRSTPLDVVSTVCARASRGKSCACSPRCARAVAAVNVTASTSVAKTSTVIVAADWSTLLVTTEVVGDELRIVVSDTRRVLAQSVTMAGSR